MDTRSASEVCVPDEQRQFLTIAEVCQRWRIDRRTLDKLTGPRLPVIQITTRVFRIPLTAVQQYEREQHFVTSQHTT